MAAAVSSMENGMSSSSRSTPQQRQQQQQQQQPQPRPQHQRRHTAGATGSRQAAGGRPIRPRLSSSSRSSSSASSSSRLSSRTSSRAPSPFRSGSSLIPSAARIGGSGPSSSSSSSSSSSISARGSRGAASGLWASIMWLGAAALPASLSPPSSSGAAAVGASPSGHGRSGSGVDGGGTRGGMAAVRTRNLSSSSSSSSSSSLSQPPSSLPETAASPARIAAEHPGLAVAAGGGRDGEAGGEAAPVRLPLPLPPPLSIGARGMGVRAEPVGGSGSAVGARGAEEEAATAAMAPVSGSGVGRAGSPKKHVYLEGSTAVYTCSMCRVHLATRDHVVSECFHGHGGRAFLFERCVNVSAGRPEDRLLMTGMHVVADISCKRCGAELGWKYEEAAEKSQKYKEGKFILERCAVALEGRSGDAYRDLSSSHSNTRYGGAERCGSRSSSSSSSSVIGWGADRSDSSARW